MSTPCVPRRTTWRKLFRRFPACRYPESPDRSGPRARQEAGYRRSPQIEEPLGRWPVDALGEHAGMDQEVSHLPGQGSVRGALWAAAADQDSRETGLIRGVLETESQPCSKYN